MKRVLVVGGGIVGLCSAVELINRGHEVSVLDPTFEEGCSYGNGGIIVPSHFVPISSPGMLKAGLRMMMDPKSPFGLSRFPDFEMVSWMLKFVRASNPNQIARASQLLKSLNLESKSLYQQMLASMKLEVSFGAKGLLMVCKSEDALREESSLRASAAKLGLSTEIFGSSDLRDLEPNVEIDALGGVLFEDDAHLTPQAVMSGLLRFLRGSGAKLIKGSLRDTVVRDRKLEAISSEGGEIAADSFVISAGVWTSSIAKNLGVNLPMLSGRGYGVTAPPGEQVWTRPAILVESRIAVTPMQDGTRFVGALELGHPTQRPNSPRLSGMLEAIPTFLPRFSTEALSTLPVWTGHRPCSPDGLPYLGNSTKLNNVTWAAGHAMMGMSLGPVSGKLVAKFVDSEPIEESLQLLSPDRYA